MKRTAMMALVMALVMVFTMTATATAQENTLAQEPSAVVEQTAAQPEEPAQEQTLATEPAQTEAEPVAQPAQEAQTTAEPADAPAAEPTEQPADVSDAQPDALAANPELTEEQALPKDVKVTTRCIVGDNLQYGDTVTVQATVQGLDNVPYLLQWQYNDGAGWKDCQGATQASYSFTLSRENAAYQWRVMITVA